MYTQFFRLSQPPFSIAPDPRHLFMSARHREALAHLLYGAQSEGGIVLLTGEIGAGKTTVCRCFLEQIPSNCNVAYIFNPRLTVRELLQAVCEEFHIALPPSGEHAGLKEYIDALNRYLLQAHAQGRNSVLVIDEAQNLSADVLEQLRLLTNLETNERKLLQIVLIGQPELRGMLARPELEQLAQRLIARYHLDALSEEETAGYIQHRLAAAGLHSVSPFPPALSRRIHRMTRGIPRRINLLCDRALLGAYAQGVPQVSREILVKAAAELFNEPGLRRNPRRKAAAAAAFAAAGIAAMLAAGAAAWTWRHPGRLQSVTPHHAPDPTSVRTGTKAAKTAGIAQDRSAASASSTVPAAPAPTAAGTEKTASGIFSDKDGPSSLALHSEDAALRELARLWGVTLTEGDACQAAQAARLRCYAGTRGLGAIRMLDRPAVLRLRDETGKPRYALLTSVGDVNAMLRAGDAMQTVNLLALGRHFDGEFVTLWRTPPEFAGTVKPGASGPDVDWIGRQLARINGERESAQHLSVDEKMLRQLREFQHAQGLPVDGLAGAVTLMRLNRIAGVEEPRLYNDATARKGARAGE